MRIVLLGREGCPTYARLEMDTINALAQLGIDAEFKHVMDEGEVKSYGIFPPAFIVNGKIKAAGRAPSFNEIKNILSTT